MVNENYQMPKGGRALELATVVKPRRHSVEDRTRRDLAELYWLIREYPDKAKEYVAKFVDAMV